MAKQISEHWSHYANETEIDRVLAYEGSLTEIKAMKDAHDKEFYDIPKIRNRCMKRRQYEQDKAPTPIEGEET